MRLLIFFLMIWVECSFSQRITISWLDNFQKELHLSCRADEDNCFKLCSSASFCAIPEGSCRNCIGTGLKINYILSELGRSIRRGEDISDKTPLIGVINESSFATLSFNDPYNIIDSYGSIRLLKRFESLCQDGSLSQIVFLKLSPLDRSIIRPEFLYCEYPESITFSKLILSPELETSLRKLNFSMSPDDKSLYLLD